MWFGFLACTTATGDTVAAGAGDVDVKTPDTALVDSARDSGPPTDSVVSDSPVDSPADTGCPDGTRPVDGACLPACAAAGGDTCVAADSTSCDGLTLLGSWDCALCCDRSVYPEPAPASFHILDRDDPWSWDSIETLVYAWDGPLLCSQNQPTDVDGDHWAQKLNATWYADGDALADAIHAALQVVDPHPRMVMVDELNSDTLAIVDAAAVRMATVYPQWRGAWGVFLVNGASVDFVNLQPAVDDLLDAGAAISVEFYPAQSSYCAAGDSAGERDVWLADFFSGDSATARFDWLRARRDDRASSSDLSVMFGVTDTYQDGTYPAWFLDRSFYVWVTRTDHADLFSLADGYPGPGAYKWDDPAMSNTSRDLAFAESYEHYVVDGDTSSMDGQVDCD